MSQMSQNSKIDIFEYPYFNHNVINCQKRKKKKGVDCLKTFFYYYSVSLKGSFDPFFFPSFSFL